MKVNKQQKRTQKNRTRRKNWVKNHRTWSKQQNNNKPGRKIAAAAPNTDMHNRYKKLAPWTAKAIKEEEKSQGNKTRNHQSKTLITLVLPLHDHRPIYIDKWEPKSENSSIKH